MIETLAALATIGATIIAFYSYFQKRREKQLDLSSLTIDGLVGELICTDYRGQEVKIQIEDCYKQKGTQLDYIMNIRLRNNSNDYICTFVKTKIRYENEGPVTNEVPPNYLGMEPWPIIPPNQLFQGSVKLIYHFLRHAGISYLDLLNKFDPENPAKLLTMDLEIEFFKIIGSKIPEKPNKIKLPIHSYYFRPDKKRWIPFYRPNK